MVESPITGHLFKDNDGTYSIWITQYIKIGQQENLSRTLYPLFDDDYTAINWFYRIHPFGTLHE
jgi:hypothetical protein